MNDYNELIALAKNCMDIKMPCSKCNCPYYEASGFLGFCMNHLADDLVKAIEQLVRERNAAVESGKELMATAQHAIKVRDAAVADLIRYTYCPVCLHFNMTVVDEPCKSCRNNGGSDDNWEWRGVQDE